MATVPVHSLSPSRTTCASLLQELQILWDEIGEKDSERDTMLQQLEQECLDIYRRKVKKNREYLADLRHLLADTEAEIANLANALGESVSFSQKGKGPLKEQISARNSVLEDLKLKKLERLKEFSEIHLQIIQIRAEIAGNVQSTKLGDARIDEHDLTPKKLVELKSSLHELKNEKTLRLQKINGLITTVHDLSVVLSIDFLKTVNEVHPSLVDSANSQSKCISNDTVARLTGLVHSLKQEKQQRLKKLQDLGSMLIDLWDLMETPDEERKQFDHITGSIYSTQTFPRGCLSLDVIEQTELEIGRLNILKASKMKQLVFKRQDELEQIYRGAHMDIDSDASHQMLISLMDSGSVDVSDLLSSMDERVANAKEQAFSRKDIVEKIEKWKYACEEEKWLDEYEKDENRYSAGRGAHINLKRAERARSLVSKIPAIVDSVTAKVRAWEHGKGVPFLYDKVPLLHILDEYIAHRREREEEKRRYREQKRLKEQSAAENPKSATKKPLGPANAGLGTPKFRRELTPSGRHGASGAKERRESGRVAGIIPVNYVALSKDDPVSRGS